MAIPKEEEKTNKKKRLTTRVFFTKFTTRLKLDLTNFFSQNST